MSKSSFASRQDRVDRLLGLLRQDSFWTIENLSDILGVSDRTLSRDINTLKEQGYPIETERGRGGGIALRHHWGINKLRLSHEEIISLLTSLAIAESLQSPILTNHAQSIRQKVANSFPEPQRKTVNQLRNRILVGEPASAPILASYNTPKNRFTDAITYGFFHLEKIEIHYYDESKKRSHRIIEPQYLLLNWPVWYVFGWDHLREAPRMFRLDRIVKARKVNETFRLKRKMLVESELNRYFDSL